MSAALKDRLIRRGLKLGFSAVRITSAQPFDGWQREIDRRRKSDPSSAGRWERMSAHPGEIMEGARAIVVAAWPYKPFKGEFPSEIGVFSSYYTEYPKGREAMIKLSLVLTEAGCRALVHPPLPAKAIALRAGLGYYGKNGVIHNDLCGSFMSIHYLLTDAHLPLDKGMEVISGCGDCRACIKACPTGAIGDNGDIVVSRCIRHHMLSSHFVPVDIREKMGASLLGCDRCQLKCPKNRTVIKQARLPSPEIMEPFEIGMILKEWKTGLKERMKRIGGIIGSNYARPQKILSMAVIAAGNSGNPSYVPLLAETLKHPHPPIRGHSAWALGKIGGEAAKSTLMEAVEMETDSRVKKEISDALLLFEGVEQ